MLFFFAFVVVTVIVVVIVVVVVTMMVTTVLFNRAALVVVTTMLVCCDACGRTTVTREGLHEARTTMPLATRGLFAAALALLASSFAARFF